MTESSLPARLSLLTERACRECGAGLRALRKVHGVRNGRTVVGPPTFVCPTCDKTGAPRG